MEAEREQAGSWLGVAQQWPDDARGLTAADASRCLTAEQAAEHLGIGRTTIYRLIDAGDLTSITIGRCRRIPLDCIAAFVARRLSDATQPA